VKNDPIAEPKDAGQCPSSMRQSGSAEMTNTRQERVEIATHMTPAQIAQAWMTN